MNNEYKEKTTQEALEKIDKELKEFKSTGQKEKAVSSHVANVLKDFCRQELEFAEAVVQTEKTLSDCCESIMKDVGNSRSDIEVYRKAVSLYFPGAGIDMVMTVNMSASVEGNDTKVYKKPMSFSLLDELL